jgi:NAD(P)-dependent dehydrogenase (short-subunit alcohol dehydrogenase family)
MAIPIPGISCTPSTSKQHCTLRGPHFDTCRDWVAASKAGLHRLTEALAEEFKQTGITVNALLPSIIAGPPIA